MRRLSMSRNIATTACSELGIAHENGVTVRGGILLPRRQRTVAVTRDLRGGGIDFVEVAEHRRDRGEQAVEIEPMKADASRVGYQH